MSFLIFGLGLLLSVCGSAAVYFGYGIVTVERGWSSVIAGATALSCGIVTIALALILRSLGKLQTFLEAEKGIKPLLSELALGRAASSPWPPQDLGSGVEPQSGLRDLGSPAREQPPAAAAAPNPVVAQAVAEAPPPPDEQIDIHRGRARILTPQPREDSRVGARESANVSRASIEDVRRLVAAKVKGWPQPEPQSAPAPVYEIAAEPRPAGGETVRFGAGPAAVREGRDARSHHAAGSEASVDAALRAEAKAAPVAAPFLAAQKAEEEVILLAGAQTAAGQAEGQIETGPFASEGGPPRAQGAPDARPGGAEAVSSGPLDEGLAIIGRYESDGTSYVMYADGSIDAQSERGVFHFKSMADLKAFMETQG
jgi:hypothetical protein